jgi:hypothetical protein
VKKNIFYSAIFWGFFQYQGHKPLLVPSIYHRFIFIIKNWEENKIILNNCSIKYFSLYIVVTFTIILTISYIIRLPHISSGQRSGEFRAINEKEVSQTVNDNRRTTLSNPFISLIDNKFTVATDSMIERLFSSLDMRVLFVQGNNAIDTFSLTEYGYFHLLDLALIVTGIALSLKNKNFKLAVTFALLYMLIGTIPNVLKTESAWITFRGAFVFLGLVLVAGIGLGYIFEKEINVFQSCSDRILSAHNV